MDFPNECIGGADNLVFSSDKHRILFFANVCTVKKAKKLSSVYQVERFATVKLFTVKWHY